MTSPDLEALSLADLKKLQKDVEKAISSYDARQWAEARAKVEAVAREMGFSLSELVSKEQKAAKSPVPAKYRHPENPELTWSGRGRRPQWFIDALAAGKKNEELAIG